MARPTGDPTSGGEVGRSERELDDHAKELWGEGGVVLGGESVGAQVNFRGGLECGWWAPAGLNANLVLMGGYFAGLGAVSRVSGPGCFYLWGVGPARHGLLVGR